MRIQLIRYHDLDNINTRLAENLNKKQGVLPPLGIAYIASSLEKAQHEVNIIDAIALGLSKQQLHQRIKEFNPKIVGITAMTPTFRGAQEAGLIAKEEDAITVIGGVHMSLFPKETLSYDYFDFGILGEGEETMVELCTAIENKQPFERIEGLAFKKNGNVYTNSPRIISDLDEIPMPAYHLLPMKRYSSIIGLHPVSTMIGSRGCPYKCGFCYKTPSDIKHRNRNPINVVDEMEFLIKNYKVKEIMFYDDLMLPSYTEALCEEILKRKLEIKWQSPQRIDLVNPKLLRLMAKAGCRILRYGVEQGDPEMMRMVEKRITLDQVKKVFRWTHEAGIDTFVYFIIGYINENERTMRASINLAKELDPKYVMFTKAVPLPQTKLMEMAVKQGIISEDYWRKFTLGEEMEAIPSLVPGADDWVKKAYREFYLRPGRIIKQISQIRSVKDIQKNINGVIGLLHFKTNEN